MSKRKPLDPHTLRWAARQARRIEAKLDELSQDASSDAATSWYAHRANEIGCFAHALSLKASKLEKKP